MNRYKFKTTIVYSSPNLEKRQITKEKYITKKKGIRKVIIRIRLRRKGNTEKERRYIINKFEKEYFNNGNRNT